MAIKHADVVEMLTRAVNNKLNVLIEGPHGTGKTSLVTGVARSLGLSLKYYSTATLDPFVDLVGLPVPGTDPDGRPGVIYHRPRDIDRAEIIFFDEFNRAQPKILNTVLEIIQFKTINGEPLPNLKCVLAACNPASEEYNVFELDAALRDRFHIQLVFDPGPDPAWFKARFAGDLGAILCDWYTADLDTALQATVSPRKLEHIGQLIQHGIDPQLASGRNSKLPFRLLLRRLHNSGGNLQVEDFLADPVLYSGKVRTDMNVAVRFLEQLLRMKPSQMAGVRDIIIAMPRELLARIKAECPFVFTKTAEAIRKAYGLSEAEMFRDIIAEELKTDDRNVDTNKAGTKAA